MTEQQILEIFDAHMRALLTISDSPNSDELSKSNALQHLIAVMRLRQDIIPNWRDSETKKG